MRKRNQEDEANAAGQAEMAQKSGAVINRDLPPVPSDSASGSEAMTPRASLTDPSSSSAPLIMADNSRRRSSQTYRGLPYETQANLDEELARSQTMRSARATSYVPTFLPILPNPFNSDDGHSTPTPTRAQTRAQTLPTIQTQRNSEDHRHQRRTSEGNEEDPYASDSFMMTPATVSPNVHRSLTFSSSLTSAANGPQQQANDPLPSPSQWLSRSPAGSRRTSTLLEDMVVYQKRLEAEMDEPKETTGAAGSTSRDPPPKYSVEEPREA